MGSWEDGLRLLTSGTVNGEEYNLTVKKDTADSPILVYWIEFIRGDWQVATPSVLARTTLHDKTDQTQDPEEMDLFLTRLRELKEAIASIFSSPGEPQSFEEKVEAMLMRLNLEETGDGLELTGLPGE